MDLEGKSAKNNKEDIILIWFNLNFDSFQDKRAANVKLRAINDAVFFSTELESCLECIWESKSHLVFLIISDADDRGNLSNTAKLNQVHSVFIFSTTNEKGENLRSRFPKVVGVFTHFDELVASIQRNIDIVNRQLETFNFCNQHQTSFRELSKHSAEFLWFQLFHDCIFRLPRDERAKAQMLSLCRSYYQGNTNQLQLIDDFEREYRPEDAIRWYSKSSFIYKIINRALRTEDIEQLFIFRFFICDLSENLAVEHQKFVNNKEETVTLYRGAKLPQYEIENMKKNEGKLISMNGFLSTSHSRIVAQMFNGSTEHRRGEVSVVFTIYCNMQQLQGNVKFANIAHFSVFPDEQEVLFNLAATFKIDSVREEQHNIWIVEMTVTEEGCIIAKKYMKRNQANMENISETLMIGVLMCDMGQFNKAPLYFTKLLEPLEEEDKAWIFFNIGRVYAFQNDLRNALENYQRALDLMMGTVPPRIQDSGRVLFNIGTTYYSCRKYREAFTYYMRALHIREEFFGREHPFTALSLTSIGHVYRCERNYAQALQYYHDALRICEISLPADHPQIGDNMENIGITQSYAKDYDNAVIYLFGALRIHEANPYPDHPYIIDIIKSTYETYSPCGDTAVLKLLSKCQLLSKTLPAFHIRSALLTAMIGDVYFEKGEFKDALDCYFESLALKEDCIRGDHPSIADTCNKIGIIADAQGKLALGLKFKVKALKIIEQNLPSRLPDMGRTLLNIAESYETINEKEHAVEYYRRALLIFEQSQPPDDQLRNNIQQRIMRLTELHQSST